MTPEQEKNFRDNLIHILEKNEITFPENIKNDTMELTTFIVKLKPESFEKFLKDYLKSLKINK